MEPKKNKVNVDPDYERNNAALRKIKEQEEEKNKLTVEKLSKIITEEFDKELAFRQKQLEDVEETICKAQKLLHLVRYVIVTSYYKKQNLEYTSTGEDPNIISGFDPQNRIHPAVKKLLGKNSNLEILNTRRRRRPLTKDLYDSTPSTSQSSTAKKIKLESKQNPQVEIKPQVGDSSQNTFKNRKRTRHRIIVGNISKWMPSLENDNTTHKWMVYIRGLKEAPDVSHIIDKVVFYLHPSYKPHDVVEVSEAPFHLSRRGWGEFPLRVQIFFKNSLNKPVSIVHNLKLDKSCTGRQMLGNETIVDLYLYDEIISLKHESIREITSENLPKNIDDIFNGKPNIISSSSKELLQEQLEIKQEVDKNIFVDIKQEPMGIKQESMDIEEVLNQQQINDTTLLDSAPTIFEHNYCHEEVITEETFVDIEIPIQSTDISLSDHSYSLPYDECMSTSRKNEDNTKTLSNETDQQENSRLMYGLDESYAENGGGTDQMYLESVDTVQKTEPPKQKQIFKTLNTVTGQSIRFLPQSFNKLFLSNGNIIQIKLGKPTQVIPKRINLNDSLTNLKKKSVVQERRIDLEKYRVTLPKNFYKNIGEALPYLFKRLPLWNELVKDLDFKCTYPYVAASEAEFRSWNVGKRLSSEWSRAKTVKKILSHEKFPEIEKWNTKTFFMYARSHGYSPLAPTGNLFRKPSVELDLLNSCFTNTLHLQRFSKIEADDIDVDVTVDELSDEDSTINREKTLIDISNKSLGQQCAFIKNAALDCGIVLKSEEISEGVTMNAVERVMLEATKCFAEGLLRRSRHFLTCQQNYREDVNEITVDEVTNALNERPELRSIRNFQRRKREMEFFL